MSRMNVAAVVAALVLVLVPSMAQAQTITACYVPKSGSVYRIKAEGSPDACKSSHVEFSWEADGGAQLGFAQRISEWKQVLPGATVAQTIDCEAGEWVIGGGHFVLRDDEQTVPAPGEVLLVASVPRWSPAQGWAASVVNVSVNPIKLQAHAVCVKPST